MRDAITTPAATGFNINGAKLVNDRRLLAPVDRVKIDITLQGISTQMVNDYGSEPFWELWEVGIMDFFGTPDDLTVSLERTADEVASDMLDGGGIN